MLAVPPTTPLSAEPVSLHCTLSKIQPDGMTDSVIVYWPVGTFTKVVCASPLVVLRLKALGSGGGPAFMVKTPSPPVVSLRHKDRARGARVGEGADDMLIGQ